MIEFGVQRERADGQQNEGHVGVDDVGEDALLERHAVVAYRFAGKAERDGGAVKSFEALAAHLA